jgi:16S rRNA (uracil1498-N3)-methyltransferase
VARLFVESALSEGAAVPLTGDQAHYLGRVMRRAPGDPVRLFNGRDGEWLGRVAALRKSAGEVRVEACARPQGAEPDLWLVFAALKRGPTDFLVEKATEIGVSVLWPMATRRTVVERTKAERLRAIAIEASEQCDRLTVPEIRPFASFDEVMARWPADRRILLCDEQREAAPIAEALARLDGPARAAPWAVMTGPEGGWDPSELDLLRNRPIVTPVALGPRLLRAETAALAALSCWQAQAGDWRSPRSDSVPSR